MADWVSPETQKLEQWVLVQGLGGRGLLGEVLLKEVASAVDGSA